MNLPDGQFYFDDVPVQVFFSARRKRACMSVHRHVVSITMPFGCSMLDVTRLLATHRKMLHRMVQQDQMISMTETSPDFRIGGRLRLLGEMHEIRLDHAIGQDPRFDGNCLYVTTQITAGIQQQVLQILRQFAKEVICDQVEQMASRHDVAYRTVKINSASSRWGSCSASGNLNFSWKLIMCAQPLIEYVVAHELAHRLHMNHSALFWREVERLCPDYQIRRKLLRIEAQRLRSWRKF